MINEGFNKKYEFKEVLTDPVEKKFNKSVHGVFSSMLDTPFEIHHLRNSNTLSDIVLLPKNDKYRLHNLIHILQYNKEHPESPKTINLSEDILSELLKVPVYLIDGKLIEVQLKDIL